MYVEYLDQLDVTDCITADVCLIGSGPAALSLAQELEDHRIRLLILESGDLAGDVTEEHTYESVGHPRLSDPRLVRNRVFGGTSSTWSGRCTLLDEMDFAERPWIPMSGWPISSMDITPFKTPAFRYLGCDEYREDLSRIAGSEMATHLPGPNSPLSSCFWVFSRDEADHLDHMRFGPAFFRRHHTNIRVILRATVTHINTTENGLAATGVETTDRQGRRFKVSSPVVVLCGGGLENPRLLLASNRTNPRGLGNNTDVVGRYLMDHPRSIIAEFDPVLAEHLRDSYSFFRLSSGMVVAAGFSLSPETQRTERLLNCASWLEEERAEDDPWEALKRLRKPGPAGRRSSDWQAVLNNPQLLLLGARKRLLQRRGVPHKLKRLFLRSLVEQAPDRLSRLSLSDKLDRFGVPLPKIDWRVGALERKSVARLAELVSIELPKRGFAPPSELFTNPEFVDAAHPSGATRMSEDASKGVVDVNCAVHGVNGLFVAGSSIFPTSGHANPTLMIVIMAIRLAHHLKCKLLS